MMLSSSSSHYRHDAADADDDADDDDADADDADDDVAVRRRPWSLSGLQSIVFLCKSAV